MKKSCLFLCLMAFGTLICRAQYNTPLELCKRILSKDTLPDIKKYCAGDFEGHPNGKDFPPNVKIVYTILQQGNNTAVINVNLSDSLGNALDTYFHFEKDTIWKVSAFRALALTGIIEQIHATLSALSPKQVDSVLASPHTAKKDYRLFKSREDYRYELGNTGLTLAPDKVLIEHFTKNKAEFESIKNALITLGIKKTSVGTRGMKNLGNIKARLRALYIDGVKANAEETNNTLNFLIGGIIDNSVGYLYIPDSKDVPEMSGDHFIMIRPLGDGWYLYKTT